MRSELDFEIPGTGAGRLPGLEQVPLESLCAESVRFFQSECSYLPGFDAGVFRNPVLPDGPAAVRMRLYLPQTHPVLYFSGVRIFRPGSGYSPLHAPAGFSPVPADQYSSRWKSAAFSGHERHLPPVLLSCVHFLCVLPEPFPFPGKFHSDSLPPLSGLCPPEVPDNPTILLHALPQSGRSANRYPPQAFCFSSDKTG